MGNSLTSQAYHIVFWQNMISPHQIHYQKYLKSLKPDWNFSLVVNEKNNLHREKMGWKENDSIAGFKIISNPTLEEVNQILKEENIINIFSGFKNFPHSKIILNYYKKGTVKGGFLAERPDFIGFKGFIRRYAYNFIERQYIENSLFFFAIGNQACHWYSNSGFASERVFPFCYVVGESNLSENNTDAGVKYSLGFVGQLEKRKGVDILLKSLSLLKNQDWELTIIGDGSEKNNLVKLSKKLKIYSNIIFCGYLNNEIVQEKIKEFDSLILPSRYDGWGAVINEALTVGTLVICSDACGGSDLIISEKQGFIFKSKDNLDLKNVLEKAITKGKRTLKERSELKKWSIEHINGKITSKYFLSILEYCLGINDYHESIPWKRL